MAEDIESTIDPNKVPPLPKGYEPIKKEDQVPPLPSGYTPVKKKGSSVSNSITAPSNSVLGGRAVSSGTSNNNGFPEIDTNTIAPGMGIQPTPKSAKKETKGDIIDLEIEKPKTRGFGSEVFHKLATGSAQLGADIAAVPELIYDAFAAPQNAIADYLDIPSLKADSEKFKKTVSVRNVVKDIYKDEVSKLREESAKVDKKYATGIYDSFKNGDISDGFRQLTNSFAESLPATSSIMLGGAYAKAPQLLAASTMVFGSGKSEQLKEENPEMSTNARIANALASGLAEGAFETIGSGSIGAAAKGLIEREGTKKASLILKDGLVDFYKEALKKNPLTASMTGEGLEEWATQVTQNSIDVATGAKAPDYNVFEGAADAFISGVFGGAVLGGGLKGIDKIVNVQDRKQIKANTNTVFSLQEELNNPNINETSQAEINKTIDNLVSKNQELIQDGISRVESLGPAVKSKLEESISNIENIKNRAKEIQLDNTSEETKKVLLDNLKTEAKEAYELRNSILEGKATEVDVLPLKEQEKLKKEALKELTAELNPDGSKNITIDDKQITDRANKIYSKQLKDESKQEITTTETQPQAEVQKPTIESEKQAVEGEENVTVNETIQETDTGINGDIQSGVDTVEEIRVTEQQGPTGESISETVDSGEGKIDVKVTDIDHAKDQIEKGVLQWNSDMGAERVNLGISWADIRKGQKDIIAGKENTVPAKRLIEALKTAKDNGGYEYVQGSGNQMQKQFVSLEDIQRVSNEENLTDAEIEIINTNQESLAKEHEDYFNSLDEISQQEILENYENRERQPEAIQRDTERGQGENDVPNKKETGTGKKPTAKERIKVANAKIDDISNALKGIDSIFGIKIKVDEIEGLNKNGIDIIDVIANVAKQAVAAGINIDEAISKTIEHLKKTIDFDVDIEAVKERINPKKETKKNADLESFRDSWNKEPSSEEINQYDSGKTIKREHGELRNNQDYEVQKDLARVEIGIKAIEHAKELFGSEYVEKTLSFIEQANLGPEKKAVAYVLLENEMDARAKQFPDNVAIHKLQDLVRAKSQEFLANSARAIGAGRFRVERFRELAKNGFSEEEFTNAILTTQQIKDKAKIQKLSQVTPDDVNAEYEKQETSVVDSDLEKMISEGVEKQINEIYKKLPTSRRIKADKAISALENIQKNLRSKAYDATIGVPIAIIDSGITIIKNSIKAGVNVADAIELGINHIKSKYGKDWKKEDDFRKDMVDGFENEGVKIKEAPQQEIPKEKKVKELVKQSLIDKGFFREIKIKGVEKKYLDWKKLAGEAGSVENIRKNVEEALKGSDYTKSEIEDIKYYLEKEYVRLSADIIEKGLNELKNRNATRKPVNVKSAAKKLAELYNYGLFEKNKDSYEKIINSVLGFNELDQKAFEEMKLIAKGYAVLMDSGLSETETKDAINTLSRRQSRLVATLAFSQSDWKFKLAVALSEITNLSTRFKLVNLGNLAENISSGMMARAANDMMDAIANGIYGKKTSNKALRKQSKINAKAKLEGITFEASESYGDTSSLLLNHSAVEDYFNNATTNKMYHALISTYMAKPVLEGADSYNKILITEAKMVRAAIRVLEAKGMKNYEALDYVAKSLTGESINEALIKAKNLIEKVNKDAGKKLLNDSKASVKSLAADIVKESLVNGGQISENELKAIYNAAYKSAGKDIGHVSNNWITDQISAKGAQIEKRVADAIKEKNWDVATGAVINQIIWKNFMSTFVGGGTNWFVKGLQKSANPLSLISLRDDIMQLKMAGELDVTTDQGIKNMEEALYRGMNLRSTSATMLMGAIITSAIIGSLAATGSDDDIEKWLKENPWAKKYFDKLVPDAIVLMLALKNKDYGRYIAKTINVKADFFDDQKNSLKILENYAKGYDENNEFKKSKASGDLGSMLGKRFELPGPLRAAKDVKQIYKGIAKGEYEEANYYTSGFLNGFFQGGIIEGLGLRKDPDFLKEQKGESFGTKPLSLPKPPNVPN